MQRDRLSANLTLLKDSLRLIGASLSEPHTSVVNGEFLCMYVCMYVCRVPEWLRARMAKAARAAEH